MAPKRQSAATENPPPDSPSSDSDSSEELTDTEQQHPAPNQSQNTNSVDSDDVESSDEDDEREENKRLSNEKSAPLHSDSDLVDNGEKSKKKAKMNVEVKKSMDLLEENGIREGLYLCNNLKSDQECFWDAYPHFKEALEIENSGSFSNEAMWVMMVELSKMGAVEAKEMEDKWRGFFVKEMELKLLRSELVKEQTQLVLDAVKTAKP